MRNIFNCRKRKLEQDIAHIEIIGTGLEAMLLMLSKLSEKHNLQILGDIETVIIQAQEVLQNLIREIIYLREVKEQKNVR